MLVILLLLLSLRDHLCGLWLWPRCLHSKRNLWLLSLLHQSMVRVNPRIVRLLRKVGCLLWSVLVDDPDLVLNNLRGLELCWCRRSVKFLLLILRMALRRMALLVLLIDLLKEMLIDMRHYSLRWLIIRGRLGELLSSLDGSLTNFSWSCSLVLQSLLLNDLLLLWMRWVGLRVRVMAVRLTRATRWLVVHIFESLEPKDFWRSALSIFGDKTLAQLLN